MYLHQNHDISKVARRMQQGEAQWPSAWHRRPTPPKGRDPGVHSSCRENRQSEQASRHASRGYSRGCNRQAAGDAAGMRTGDDAPEWADRSDSCEVKNYPMGG